MSFFLDDYDIIDLTMILSHDDPMFPVPGVQQVKIEKDLQRALYGANADKMAMSCHAGTHLDGPWHFCSRHDSYLINEIRLDGGRLVGEGVIVDISGMCGDYDIYGKEQILNAGVEVKKGDILIIHTGYHKYQVDQTEPDVIKYYYRHPGPNFEFAQWCIDMKINYLGIDGGTQGHPINVLQGRNPAEDEAFCKKHGVKTLYEIFPKETWQFMHKLLFPHGIIHIENMGGDIRKAVNKRCIIGCFPLKIRAESSPCRAVAFMKKE